MITKKGGNWLWKGQIVEELKGRDANAALEWANVRMADLEKNQKGQRQDPTNAEVKLDGGAITIRIPDPSVTFGKSKKGEGKNWIVATTHGNFPVKLPNGRTVKVGLNVYSDVVGTKDHASHGSE